MKAKSMQVVLGQIKLGIVTPWAITRMAIQEVLCIQITILITHQSDWIQIFMPDAMLAPSLPSHPPGAGQTLPWSQPAAAQLAEDPFAPPPTRPASPSLVPSFDLWQPGSALSCVGYLQARQPGRR